MYLFIAAVAVSTFAIYKSEKDKRDLQAMYDRVDASIRRWQREERAK